MVDWPGSGGGSSPRVWGTLITIEGENKIARFIPTGVGNTDHVPEVNKMLSVHPHGCGEHTQNNILLFKLKIRVGFFTGFLAVFQVVNELFYFSSGG